MSLKSIFLEDINRPIEGVIKADDDAHLFQEVTEYVITKEVNRKISNLFEQYNDYQGINGVWISGFFGSGKSHLLKMLSLLLENKSFEKEKVSDLFLPKVNDEVLKAEITKAVNIPSKSILFNIDQKADIISKDQEDAVLSVFVKVFNEMQGYYPKLGHIAEFERDLDNEGLYEKFKTEFEKIAGRPWETRRKRLKMAQDSFAEALANVKNISKEAAIELIGQYREDYRMSIEDFAGMVKDYIDKQPPGFRLNFFVDEVGQYISDNTKLMTNLQTIAESLATKCQGQAWIFVTSQEDLSTVIGALKEKQSQDFSKISDRFRVKVNLTSSDASEVIQKRLLSKNETGEDILVPIYKKEQNNFKTLFQFSEGGRTYRGFEDDGDFITKYPFLTYQFNMFQDSIRGLSVQNAFQGKHQSVGERSMLGVFQDVVKGMIRDDMKVGRIAGFDRMYDGIERTLRGEIQTSVKRAEQHLADKPLCIRVLKILFLVKYIKEFKPTIKHLGILLIEDFGVDLSKHETALKEALNILEYQTYIQRNGNEYEYLTNEEKNIENEIKATEIDETEVNDFFSRMVYDDVIRDVKIRYQDNKQDYPFSRRINGATMGREYELSLDIITSLHENYESVDLLKSHNLGKPELLMRLSDDARLMSDIRNFKKTETYIRQNNSATLKEEIRHILQRKNISNNELKSSLVTRVNDLLSKATFILDGREKSVANSNARNRVAAAFQDLISFAYPNLRMLKGEYNENNLRVIIQSQPDDLFKHNEDSLSEAEREVLADINRNAKRGERTTVKAILDRFGKRPYGWSEMGTLCIVARLYVRKKIEVKENSEILDNRRILDNLLSNRQYAQTILEALTEVDAQLVKNLKELHHYLFNETNSGKEPKEVALQFQDKLKAENAQLKDYLKQQNRYPFLTILNDFQKKIETYSRKSYGDYFTLLTQMEDDLLDFKEDKWDPIKKFMEGNQRKIFDDISNLLDSKAANFRYVSGTELADLETLRHHQSPFTGNAMQAGKEQLDTFRQKLKTAIADASAAAIATIDRLREKLEGYEDFQKITPTQQDRLRDYFAKTISQIQNERHIANIRDLVREFEDFAFQEHIRSMVTWAEPKPAAAAENTYPATTSTATPAADGVRESIPIPKTATADQFIAAQKIKVPFKKPYLRTEKDVEEYVERLKAAYLKQIQNNKGITL